MPASKNIISAAPTDLPQVVERVDKLLQKSQALAREAVKHYVLAGEALFRGFDPSDTYLQADYIRDVLAQAANLPGWSESTVKRLLRWGSASLELGRRDALLACRTIPEGDRLLSPNKSKPPKKRKSAPEPDARIEHATARFGALVVEEAKKLSGAPLATTDEGVHGHESTHPEKRSVEEPHIDDSAEVASLRAKVAERDAELAAIRDALEGDDIGFDKWSEGEAPTVDVAKHWLGAYCDAIAVNERRWEDLPEILKVIDNRLRFRIGMLPIITKSSWPRSNNEYHGKPEALEKEVVGLRALLAELGLDERKMGLDHHPKFRDIDELSVRWEFEPGKPTLASKLTELLTSVDTMRKGKGAKEIPRAPCRPNPSLAGTRCSSAVTA